MRKFICLFTSLIFVFTALLSFGCSCDKQNEQEPEHADGGRNYDIIEGKYIIENGKTEYSILVPQNMSDLERYASSELRSLLFEASGIEFVESTSFVENGKYLSIGNTELKTKAEIAFSSENNSHCFKIKTIGDSLVIAGNGDYGDIWGVYELMSILFDYEQYSAEIMSINRGAEAVNLIDIDFTDEPDIELRTTADSQSYRSTSLSRKFRWLNSSREVFISAPKNWCHNSAFWLGGDVDVNNGRIITGLSDNFLATTGKQICYTAHGDPDSYEDMLNIVSEGIINNAASEPTKSDVMFGIMDGVRNQWCKCNACESFRNAHGGANSAVVIKFCNDLHKKIETYFDGSRHINVIFFAYDDVEDPPTGIKCDSGVYVMYAPINANWMLPFNESNNNQYYEKAKLWKTVSDELYLWAYHTNFDNFFAPYDCFNVVQTNYKIFAEDLKVKYLFDQGRQATENSSGFFTLIEYLNSKLSWDVNADVSELTNKFFEKCYGPASDIMKKWYKEMRSLLSLNFKYKDFPGGVQGQGANIIKNEFWPQGTLNSWVGYADEALNKIKSLEEKSPELYSKYAYNIKTESMSPRYLLLKIYADQNSSKTIAEKQEFINECRKLNFTKCADGPDISKAFDI